MIGVKLNMAMCGYKVDHINHLKPQVSSVVALSGRLLNSLPDFSEAELILCFVYFQKLFEHVRNHGIAIEHWPSWISRELSTASTTPINNEDED